MSSTKDHVFNCETLVATKAVSVGNYTAPARGRGEFTVAKVCATISDENNQNPILDDTTLVNLDVSDDEPNFSTTDSEFEDTRSECNMNRIDNARREYYYDDENSKVKDAKVSNT